MPLDVIERRREEQEEQDHRPGEEERQPARLGTGRGRVAGLLPFFFGSASSCRLLHCVDSASTTTRPNSPADSSAARQPSSAARKIIVAGAAAEPRWPAKVWMEKARPIRCGLIEALRMA